MATTRSIIRLAVLFSLVSVVLVAFLGIAHEQTQDLALLLKIILVYLILLTACALWIIAIIHNHLGDFRQTTLTRHEDSEKLLLDLRDGTRQYYKQKRKSVRIKSDITAQLKKENVCDFIKAIDLSYDGALLKTERAFQVGDTIGLDLYLPLFPRPVHINVLVVRVLPQEKADQPTSYQIGVKYLQMSKEVRAKLVETLDTLSKGKQTR